ncbi:MAG: recombinase family protein [Anaerotignum sp.]|nr:recombinase family protein [Anaerotignum sp.]
MIKRMGIYLRLSDEDENAKESNSIKGQRELIQHYIMNHKELSPYETVEFCDDGYSGTSFQRPGVMELLGKVKNGEIDCIIVKDFSRFGRNYIEVGSFIEQVFPFLGVRFISINDNFDSDKLSANGAFMATAFQNLIYDLYSKDLSQKISSVRRAKAKGGKFITAFAPYGYQKTKAQQLVADKETAPIVQRIFNMAFKGTPQVQIARTLNDEKIPSPLFVRKMRKESFSCATVSEKYLWYPAAISTILKDQRYVGDGVYGKVKPKSAGSSQDKAVPKEDWIIVPNTHEAIVSRAVFEQVNAKAKSYRPRNKEVHYPLWKKVRCGVCNHTISRKKSGGENGQGTARAFRCTSPNVSQELGCFKGKLEERQLEGAILLFLNTMLASVYDEDLQEFFIKQAKEEIQISQEMIKRQEVRLKQISVGKMQQYEAYRAKKLRKEDFLNKKIGSERLYKKTENVLFLEQDKMHGLCFKLQKNSETINVNELVPFQSVTRQLVEAFVERIFIEQNGSIKIFWKFQDIFQQ